MKFPEDIFVLISMNTQNVKITDVADTRTYEHPCRV